MKREYYSIYPHMKKRTLRWTPPASDHELNKRLADAIGLEVVEATYTSSNYIDGTGWVTEREISWRIVDGLDWWSPRTDWNQAMRCAERVRWNLNRYAAGAAAAGDRVEYSNEHRKSLLRAFCHVLLQALEHGEEQAAA